MAYSYPIWVDVNSCIYNSNKSYGAKDTNEQTIYCGSSASNSEELVRIVNYKREFTHKKYGEVIAFRTQVDGVLLKEALFKKTKQGRAGEHIKTRTHLNRLKGLKRY